MADPDPSSLPCYPKGLTDSPLPAGATGLPRDTARLSPAVGFAPGPLDDDDDDDGNPTDGNPADGRRRWRDRRVPSSLGSQRRYLRCPR